MKNVIFASVVAMIAAACGSQESAPESSSVQAAQESASRAKRELNPIDGFITQVKAQSAQGSAAGLWTDVTVQFVVPCTEKLESASVSYSIKNDGKVEVLANAYTSREKAPVSGLSCRGMSLHRENITLPGIYTKNDLRIINLIAPKKDIPNDTAAIVSTDKVKVVATSPLCPQGMVCITDGTIVTIEATLGSCVNKLGVVAYHGAKQAADAPLELTVKPIEFVSKKVPVAFCGGVTKVKYDISLPMVFADKKNVKLSVLK